MRSPSTWGTDERSRGARLRVMAETAGPGRPDGVWEPAHAAAVAAMGREYEASERLTWEYIQIVRTLADAGQRRRYDTLVVRSCGGECSMETMSARVP